MTIRMVIVLGLSLYTTRIVLHELGISDYGIYNVVGGIVAMFTFLSNAMSNAIQRFYSYEIGKNDSLKIQAIYKTSLIVQFIIACIVLVSSEIIGTWYIDNKINIPISRIFAAKWILHFSIFSLIVIIFQAPYSALIIAKERMNYYAIVSVINAVLSLLIAIALKFASADKLIIYGALFFIVQLISFFAYFFYCKKNFKEARLTSGHDINLIKSLSSFSTWSLIGSFAWILKDQGVNLILNIFYGPAVNAARGIAVQVNGGVQSFVSNIGVSIRPQITQAYAQGNIQRTMSLTYSFSKLSCIMLYIFSLPLLLELDFVLEIWLGNTYPDHTKSFILIIVITSFISNFNTAISGVVHSSGKMKLYQISAASLNLLSIPFVYFFLKSGSSPEIGFIVIFLSMVIIQTSSLIILKKIINYSIWEYTRNVIFPFLLTVIISIILPLIIHYLLPAGTLRFIIIIFLSLITISFSFYYLGCNSSERELFRMMLNKVLCKSRQIINLMKLDH